MRCDEDTDTIFLVQSTLIVAPPFALYGQKCVYCRHIVSALKEKHMLQARTKDSSRLSKTYQPIEDYAVIGNLHTYISCATST